MDFLHSLGCFVLLKYNLDYKIACLKNNSKIKMYFYKKSLFMKKITLILLSVLIFSCAEEPKDFVIFSGKITNSDINSLQVRKKGYSKTIQVNENGNFNDTLKIDTGIYSVYIGKERTTIFLKNGYEIDMSIDVEQFDETVSYSGVGSKNSNFLAKKSLLEEKLLEADLNNLDQAGLNTKMTTIEKSLNEYIDNAKDIDTMIINSSKKDVKGLIKSYKNYYSGLISLRKALPKGATSPTFNNYENYAGGTTSLEDLKGKYVYIDVWATWCGPCKVEIPHLKKIEADYHDKEIAFVSMSIDDDRTHKGSWELANKDWRAMVADKKLGGIQIMAPKGWQSQFIKDYKIKGIPRFILIDKEGNIIDASAPRPSDPKLREVFDRLI
jgi:thiol-disulfide isomerase/thioredoxin